jgi:argininosuccinate synthase
MRVVLAFSGGLDTSFCVAWLREQHGAEVITAFVDTGGVGDDERERIAEQSRALGAASHRSVDARRAVWDEWISTLLRGNVLRGEVYPLSVAAERTQQAIEVAALARELGADAVAHGSTGAGNDQIRFDVALRVLAPKMEVLTPIRDLGLSREQTVAFLRERALPLPEGSERYSVNRGLWGTTIGGDWTHDPWSGPPSDAWGDKATPAGDPREVAIGWERGLPARLCDEQLAGPDLVERLSALTRPLRIGFGIHLGETALGIKGRIGFEAGAALVLIAAHRELEKLVLTRWQSFWKDHLARFWGDRLHEGQAFDPVMADIAAMVESSQARVEGETRVRLEPGSFQVVGVRSPHTLMRPEIARYGETHDGWTGDEARAFAKLGAMSSLIAARAAGPER